MPIVYCLIARGSVVLAEYATASGNFMTISRIILDNLPQVDGKKSYEYDA
jgi:vesicle-associated membrane protein 7